MADNETGEIDILETMRDAIVHGIDSNGNVVASGTTPDYGGNSSGEDFYIYVEGSQVSLPVFSPMLYEDHTHSNAADLVPFVEITFEPSVASRHTFGREVRAGLSTWSIVLGENEGYVNLNSTDYRNERACMILRDRLIRMAERMAFNDVILLERRDAEPTSVYEILEDRRFYRADVSVYIEFWPEIT